MIGLIRKDFYTLGRYGRFMLIYLLVFGVLFAGQGSGSFISSMMVVMVTIMSISTFSASGIYLRSVSKHCLLLPTEYKTQYLQFKTGSKHFIV